MGEIPFGGISTTSEAKPATKYVSFSVKGVLVECGYCSRSTRIPLEIVRHEGSSSMQLLADSKDSRPSTSLCAATELWPCDSAAARGRSVADLRSILCTPQDVRAL